MRCFLLVGILFFYSIRLFLLIKNKSYFKIKVFNNHKQTLWLIALDIFGMLFLFLQLFGIFDIKWNLNFTGFNIIGLFLFALGLVFSSWSRLWLNYNWNTAAVGCIKYNHQLITNGPFAISRHPVYLGTWFLFFGWQLALNSYFILSSFFLALLIYWQANREEAVLKEHFGEKYIAYQQKVSKFF